MEEAKEVDLRNLKIMGGIGAILLLIFPVVGFILILIAVKQLSDEIKREDIFRDFLICTIISSLAFIIVIFVIFFSTWLSLNVWISSPSPSMPSPHPPYPPTPQFPPEKPDIFFFLFLGVIFLLSWAINSVASYFAQRGFLSLADITGERNFSLSGRLIFLGALLYIILVGWVAYLVGIILAITSFFSLPDRIPLKGEEGYG
jgi:uncharacterized membrane protein